MIDLVCVDTDDCEIHIWFTDSLVCRSKPTAESPLLKILDRYQSTTSNLQIDDGIYGKKKFANSMLSYSISYADSLSAIAIGKNVEVGLDVEKIDRRRQCAKLMTRYFPNYSTKGLSDKRIIDNFYSLWTAKESEIKLNGSSVLCLLDTHQSSTGSQNESCLSEVDFGRLYKGHVASKQAAKIVMHEFGSELFSARKI